MKDGHENKTITRDLIRKGADDIGAVIRRLRSIAPRPFMPVAVGLAGAAIVALAAELAVKNGAAKDTPDPDCMILAALLAARCGISADDPINAAYADFEALKSAGRVPPDALLKAENRR
jgi:hypothetical protein